MFQQRILQDRSNISPESERTKVKRLQQPSDDDVENVWPSRYHSRDREKSMISVKPRYQQPIHHAQKVFVSGRVGDHSRMDVNSDAENQHNENIATAGTAGYDDVWEATLLDPKMAAARALAKQMQQKHALAEQQDRRQSVIVQKYQQDMVQLDDELAQRRERLKAKTKERLLRRQQTRKTKVNKARNGDSDDEIAEEIELSPGADDEEDDILDHQKVVCRHRFVPKPRPPAQNFSMEVEAPKTVVYEDEVTETFEVAEKHRKQEEKARKQQERVERAKRAAKKARKKEKKLVAEVEALRQNAEANALNSQAQQEQIALEAQRAVQEQAAKLLADAKAQAERMTREAQEHAQRTRMQADEQANRLREAAAKAAEAQANQMKQDVARAAAEEAEKTRLQAEEEATQTKATATRVAEAEAHELKEAAEREALETKEKAAREKQELKKAQQKAQLNAEQIKQSAKAEADKMKFQAEQTLQQAKVAAQKADEDVQRAQEQAAAKREAEAAAEECVDATSSSTGPHYVRAYDEYEHAYYYYDANGGAESYWEEASAQHAYGPGEAGEGTWDKEVEEEELAAPAGTDAAEDEGEVEVEEEDIYEEDKLGSTARQSFANHIHYQDESVSAGRWPLQHHTQQKNSQSEAHVSLPEINKEQRLREQRQRSPFRRYAQPHCPPQSPSRTQKIVVSLPKSPVHLPSLSVADGVEKQAPPPAPSLFRHPDQPHINPYAAHVDHIHVQSYGEQKQRLSVSNLTPVPLSMPLRSHSSQSQHADAGAEGSDFGAEDDEVASAMGAAIGAAMGAAAEGGGEIKSHRPRSSGRPGSSRIARGGRAGMHTKYRVSPNQQVFSAVRHNRFSVVQEAVTADVSDPNHVPLETCDQNGNTLLIIAAQNGLKKMMKMLVRSGADINAQNRTGNTALHYAMAYKFPSVIDFLTKNGAHREAVNHAGELPHEFAGKRDANQQPAPPQSARF